MCLCVRACVRACVCACVRVCVCKHSLRNADHCFRGVVEDATLIFQKSFSNSNSTSNWSTCEYLCHHVMLPFDLTMLRDLVLEKNDGRGRSQVRGHRSPGGHAPNTPLTVCK